MSLFYAFTCAGSPPLGENVVAAGNSCRSRESAVWPPAIVNATLPAVSDSTMARRFMGTEIIRDTLAFLLIMGAAAGVQAQTAAEPPNPLTQVKGLKCQFPSATSASWKEGAPQAQTKTQDMRFDITNIDVQDATAEFMGTAGPRLCHRRPVGMEPLLCRKRRRATEHHDRLLPGSGAQEAEGRAFAPRLSPDAGRPLHRRAIRLAELRRV